MTLIQVQPEFSYPTSR